MVGVPPGCATARRRHHGAAVDAVGKTGRCGGRSRAASVSLRPARPVASPARRTRPGGGAAVPRPRRGRKKGRTPGTRRWRAALAASQGAPPGLAVTVATWGVHLPEGNGTPAPHRPLRRQGKPGAHAQLVEEGPVGSWRQRGLRQLRNSPRPCQTTNRPQARRQRPSARPTRRQSARHSPRPVPPPPPHHSSVAPRRPLGQPQTRRGCPAAY